MTNTKPNLINLADSLSKVNGYWSPLIVGELNDHKIQVAKLKGEFVWHKHQKEEEMFLVIKGGLVIHFRDKDVSVGQGEIIVIPKGVEHKPEANDEVEIMLIEPKRATREGD